MELFATELNERVHQTSVLSLSVNKIKYRYMSNFLLNKYVAIKKYNCYKRCTKKEI